MTKHPKSSAAQAVEGRDPQRAAATDGAANSRAPRAADSDVRALELWEQRFTALRARKDSGTAIGFAAESVLDDRVNDIEDAIDALDPSSPCVAAAQLMIAGLFDLSDGDRPRDCEHMAISLKGLAALRERTRGRIRADVDELLDNPERRVVEMGVTAADTDERRRAVRRDHQRGAVTHSSGDLNESDALATPQEIVERRLAAEQTAKNQAFSELFSKWLIARAACEDHALPDDDEAASEVLGAREEAERQLLVTPAPVPRAVWMKWEVLELSLAGDYREGLRSDARTLLALGAIKADLVSFGFGE
jgi:hypothetical protein